MSDDDKITKLFADVKLENEVNEEIDLQAEALQTFLATMRVAISMCRDHGVPDQLLIGVLQDAVVKLSLGSMFAILEQGK